VINTTPRPLYRRVRPGTHCTEGWVVLRAGLDGCGKSSPHGGGGNKKLVLLAGCAWFFFLQASLGGNGTPPTCLRPKLYSCLTTITCIAWVSRIVQAVDCEYNKRSIRGFFFKKRTFSLSLEARNCNVLEFRVLLTQR